MPTPSTFDQLQIAEPLTRLTDAAIVARPGAEELTALGAGAAIASTVSPWTGAVFCLAFILKKLGFSFDIDTSDIKRLMKIGHDMFFRTGYIGFEY